MRAFSNMTDKLAALFSAAVVLVWMIVVVVLAIAPLQPPAMVPATAPATDFSAARAMRQVAALAPGPHWIGSDSNKQVRDQLVNDLTTLGVKAEVQRTTAYRYGALANVENVVARLDGTANTRAILVVAHYDAVPTGPGGGYAGVAAAMLETLRALKAGPPLRNDLIFLFTDAEETGLQGAQGFWDDDPWAKEVGMVLSFIGRGDAGTASMLETGPANAWVIQQFAQAAPYPSANSLAQELYRVLPYNTDFTVFKTAGLPGLNFAFIGNLVRYHALTDSAENVDPRSIQHIGDYSLPLLRQLGNADLSAPHSGDAVYFDTWGWSMLVYPLGAAVPLAVVAALIVLGVIIVGFSRHRLSRGVILGFLAFLAMLIVTVLLVEGVWTAVSTAFKVPLVWAETYNSEWYALAFVSLSVAIMGALYTILRRRVRWTNLAVGAILWWLILALASAAFVPGGSHMFVVPLLFGSVGLGLLFLLRETAPDWWKRVAVLCLAALPALMLMGPFIRGLFIVQGIGASVAVVFLVVLLLGLLMPQLEALVTVSRGWLPLAALVAAVAFIAVGLFSFRNDSQQPRTDFVRYILNADTHQAIWFTTLDQPDEWTAQFFPKGITTGSVSEVLPFAQGNWGSAPAPAPAVTLEAPRADVLADQTTNGVRSLRLRITSPRHALLMSVYFDPSVPVQSAIMNGKKLDLSMSMGTTNHVDYYAFPSDGAELDVTVAAGQPVRLALIDQTQGLPALGATTTQPQGMPPIGAATIRPRPANLIPVPAGDLSFVSDTTLVAKSYSFGATPSP